MPGAGKTTLGKAVAAHFGLPFLDLDAEIVAHAGQVIPAIFLQHGEAYFRQLEAQVLREVLSRPTRLVLATGGGTPCFHDNLAALNTHSTTLWLDVPPATLRDRLSAAIEKNTRPLLASTGPTEKWLRETLDARKEFYSRARLRCEGTACTAEAVATQLAAAGFAASPSADVLPGA